MEPRYSISYQVKERYMRDLMKWSCYHSPQSKLLFVLIGILAAADAMTYVLPIWYAHKNGLQYYIDPITVLLTTVVVLYAVYMLYFRYRRMLRVAKKRYLELENDDRKLRRATFFEDLYASSQGGGETVEYYYSDIKQIYRWKDYLILQTRNKTFHYFPGEFSGNCTQDQLADFLRDKGIKD